MPRVLRQLVLVLLAVGVLALPPAALARHSTHRAAATAACRHDYYKNVDGRCVHRPATSPVGATARFRDGSYSYSLHASGACSYHGGVAVWIHHP